jgi:hypothetical protein
LGERIIITNCVLFCSPYESAKSTIESLSLSLYDYGCMALLMSLTVLLGIETSASEIALMDSSATEPNNTAVSIFYHVPLFLFQRILSSHDSMS